MTSSKRLLGWILIGSALIIGATAAIVYRDDVSTFIVAGGDARPESLVFIARVENDDTQRAVTDFTTAPGQQVTYSAHFFTPRTKATFRGNVIIDVNEAYLSKITSVTKGCKYDGDKISCPLNGNVTFGRFSFTGTTQFSSAAATGGGRQLSDAPTRVGNQFVVEAEFCLDRGQCLAKAVKGSVLQQIRARDLGMSLKASVQGGGTAKAGSTLIYDLTLTNSSAQPITVSGNAQWPTLLAPSVVTQPSSGTIFFEGKKMQMGDVKIPANGTVTAKLSAVVGKIQKGQPQYVELIAEATNGDAVRTGSNIKGNFILIEIGAAPATNRPVDQR